VRLLGIAGLLAAAGLFGIPPQEEELPSVLILILDDVALTDVDRLELPTLDRLADMGVSFRRAYSMPICGPTRYTLMFGRYQRIPPGKPCQDSVKTAPDTAMFSLPKLMKSRGYATGAFGKWHVGSNRTGAWEATPGLHGFDVWRAISPSNVTRCGSTGYSKWLRADDGESHISTEYHTTAVRDALLGWWRTTAGPKFALGDNGTPPESVRDDQHLGNVKQSTFEDGVRVPFLVHGPGLEASFETEALIHTVDLLATLAELTGAELPEGVETDSVSFARSLRDPAARTRTHVFVEYQTSGLTGGGGAPRGSKRRRAVITERWKLRRVGRVEELYDLESDPGETAPIPLGGEELDPSLAAIVTELRQRLDGFEKD